MILAQEGDTVKVHYTARLASGMVFDSSLDRDPLEFTIGGGRLLNGFERAVVGLLPGEENTVELSPEDSYGAYQRDLIMQIDKGELPDDLEPEVGQQFQFEQKDGQLSQVRITHVDGNSVTIDTNHPLAGQGLTFEIQLLEIS